eukprot:c20691_g1_i1.p1 GENE.c20691_g1_i1~~c20691_g1_i1.p1  ORF type:complete len:287 (+),score=81.66 c20691_g1_i1:80-940(+)
MDKKRKASEQINIRQKYNRINESLEANIDDICDPKSKSLTNTLDDMEAVYSQVKTTTESMLDAIAINAAAKRGRKQAQNLVESQKITETEFISGVKGRYALTEDARNVDWIRLGRDASNLLNETPRMCTMYGPVMKDLKLKSVVTRQRKAPEEREKAVLNATLAADQKAFQANEETTEATKRIETLARVLTSEPQPVDVFSFITNPQSFSETVENLFDLSFLIRDGSARLGEAPDHSTLVLSKCDREKKPPASNQCIITLNANRFQALGQLCPPSLKIPARNKQLT